MINIIRWVICLFIISIPVLASDYTDVLERMDGLKQGSQLKVLENQLFSKSKKLEIRPKYGLNVSDPYVDVSYYGVALAFYFNEFFGFELGYASVNSEATKLNSQLMDQFPDSGDIAALTESFYNFNVLVTPIYAKASLLSNFILHYDIFLTAGVGQTKTSWESAFTYNYGLGIRMYIFKRLGLVVEARDYIHSEKRKSLVISRHDLLVSAGLSIFLF